jgi:hypothetical protein
MSRGGSRRLDQVVEASAATVALLSLKGDWTPCDSAVAADDHFRHQIGKSRRRFRGRLAIRFWLLMRLAHVVDRISRGQLCWSTSSRKRAAIRSRAGPPRELANTLSPNRGLAAGRGGVGAGPGEGVEVSMLSALTHVVNVAFGDDAVGAACGLDQGGAGCVEGLPGAGDGAVGVGGVLGQATCSLVGASRMESRPAAMSTAQAA